MFKDSPWTHTHFCMKQINPTWRKLRPNKAKMYVEISNAQIIQYCKFIFALSWYCQKGVENLLYASKTYNHRNVSTETLAGSLNTSASAESTANGWWLTTDVSCRGGITERWLLPLAQRHRCVWRLLVQHQLVAVEARVLRWRRKSVAWGAHRRADKHWKIHLSQCHVTINKLKTQCVAFTFQSNGSMTVLSELQTCHYRLQKVIQLLIWFHKEPIAEIHYQLLKALEESLSMWNFDNPKYCRLDSCNWCLYLQLLNTISLCLFCRRYACFSVSSRISDVACTTISSMRDIIVFGWFSTFTTFYGK